MLIKLNTSKQNIKQNFNFSKEESLKNPSEQLKKNLQLSKKINEWVRQQIPFSPNYPMLSNTTPKERKKQNNILKKQVRSQPKEHRLSLSVRYQVGNCWEVSELSSRYPLMPKDIFVDLFHIKGGDHAANILSNGKLGNDPNAVFFSNWEGTICPYSMIDMFLLNYCRLESDPKSGVEYTLVRPFSKNSQTLELKRRPKLGTEAIPLPKQETTQITNEEKSLEQQKTKLGGLSKFSFEKEDTFENEGTLSPQQPEKQQKTKFGGLAKLLAAQIVKTSNPPEENHDKK